MYESGENYLETILILKEKMGSVRSIDVSRMLNFSKPSVSRGVGLLRDDGYITISEEGFLKLTTKGQEKAESIYERHKTLTAFLVKVSGVSKDIAEEDACHIEHIISQATFQGIKDYLSQIE